MDTPAGVAVRYVEGGEMVDPGDLPTDLVMPTALQAFLSLVLIGTGCATTARVGRMGATRPRPARDIG